jgi:hypothetical protein
MRERPILFSAPMVRAILDGTKRQTRRAVKLHGEADEVRRIAVMPPTPDRSESWMFTRGSGGAIVPCPYGEKGDRLWVRETWDARSWTSGNYPERLKVCYGADGEQREFSVPVEQWPSMDRGDRWRPSIHMPRWASRITLAVESVRVERLRDISEEDAKAEGVEPAVPVEWPTAAPDYCAGFERLWREINGAESWDANPWVWVIGFSRVNTKGGA